MDSGSRSWNVPELELDNVVEGKVDETYNVLVCDYISSFYVSNL